MAIVWGAANGAYRLGVQATRLSQSATEETWRGEVFLQKTSVTWNASVQTHVSGSFTFNGSTPVVAGGDVQRLWVEDKKFTRQAGVESGGRITASISGFHYSVPGAEVTFKVTPRAPSSMPGPTNVTAKYADGRVVLSWNRNTVGGVQVGHFNIDRRRENGAWEGFRVVAPATAASYSITDTGVLSGERYQYTIFQVNAQNLKLFGATVSNWVDTVPFAPANVQATRSGSDIELSWRNPNNNTALSYSIFEGGTLIAGDIPASATSWLIQAPTPTKPHKYQIQAITENGLKSELVESNSVLLLAAPNAPLVVAPTGGYCPAGEPVRFEWQHQPVDGTEQRRFSIRYRTNGGAWTAINQQTAESSYVLDKTFTDGTRLEWQVCTQGGHESFSPYSPLQVLEIVDRPSLRILYPGQGSKIDKASTMVVLLSDVDEPARWKIEAKSSDGKFTKTGSGYGQPAIKWEITDLPNKITVSLEAVISSRVDSLPATSTFTVEYAAPLIPSLTASWSENASINLKVVNPAGGVSVDENLIQRWDAAKGWITVGSLTAGQEANIFTDYLPPTSGPVKYRAVAVSRQLSTRSFSTPLELEECPLKGIFFNWGAGWQSFSQLRFNPGMDTRHGFYTDKTYVLAGDSLPTVVRGKARSRVQQLRGMLIPQKTSEPDVQKQLEAIRALAAYPGIVALRTVDDQVRFGVVSDVSYVREIWGGYSISLTHTETNGKEQ